jgi:hypothetical protein
MIRESDHVASSTRHDPPSSREERRDSDKLERLLAEPVDDVDREVTALADLIASGEIRVDQQQSPDESDVIEEGRMMAIFSHFSIMFGIPVFVATFFLRDNAFALHHAKAAGVIYLACLTMLALALLNCAFFLPLVFVCYIPALIGIYRAAAGVEAGTAALGTIGERVFSWVKLKS